MPTTGKSPIRGDIADTLLQLGKTQNGFALYEIGHTEPFYEARSDMSKVALAEAIGYQGYVDRTDNLLGAVQFLIEAVGADIVKGHVAEVA